MLATVALSLICLIAVVADALFLWALWRATRWSRAEEQPTPAPAPWWAHIRSRWQ